MSIPPQPPTPWPPPAGGGGTDRTLLRIIAVFSAVTALGVVIALGIWGYSWWQAQKMLDGLSSTFADASELPNLVGTWSGDFVYPGGKVDQVTLDVDSSDPVSGRMTFHSGPCVVQVSETYSSSATLSFDTTSMDDEPQRCAAWGKWEVSIGSSSIDGTLVDSAIPQLDGSSLKLERSN